MMVDEKIDRNEFIQAQDAPARRLVVTFHGFGGPQRMRRVVAIVHADMPDSDVFAPIFRFSRFGVKHPSRVAARVVSDLDKICADQEYEDILFINYSMGAALARKVLIGGWGQINEAPFESEFAPPNNPGRTWHRKVSRLVNIAGMTRGWVVSNRQRLGLWLFLNGFGLLGHIIPGYLPTLFRLRRGAPFIVNMRLQWLALMRQAADQRPDLLIVNLLGSVDNLVGPTEVIDFAGDAAGCSKVHFIQVPASDHTTILDVQPWEPKSLTQNWESRRRRLKSHLIRAKLLRTAMVGAFEGMSVPDVPFKNPPVGTVASVATRRAYLDDDLPSTPNPNIDHLVFVIHGIRDDGYWTKKVAAKIKNLADENAVTFASNTRSYGYYTAIPFALPWIRRQKVEWLMDLYATARAIYPNAKFSYVGHSNGTYLAAYALENYETCVFDRVVFAGSVVRKNYNWKTMFEGDRPKVVQLLNYVATNDLVVALFAKGLQPLRFFNLGSAGHDGFADSKGCRRHICEVRYVQGGHGAGIQESQWDVISEFVVNGASPETSASTVSDYRGKRNAVSVIVGALSTAILVLAVVFLATVGWALFAPLIDYQWSAAASPRVLSWLDNFGLGNWYSSFASRVDASWNGYDALVKGWNVASFAVYLVIVRYFFFRF